MGQRRIHPLMKALIAYAGAQEAELVECRKVCNRRDLPIIIFKDKTGKVIIVDTTGEPNHLKKGIRMDEDGDIWGIQSSGDTVYCGPAAYMYLDCMGMLSATVKAELLTPRKRKGA